MNKPLLLKLADLLDNLPDDKFDFEDYGHTTYPAKEDAPADLGACGTVACALGWATTIPECGLRLLAHEGFRYLVVETTDSKLVSVDAAMRAFDIDRDTARRLFIYTPRDFEGFRYTASDCANNIRRVVASK